LFATVIGQLRAPAVLQYPDLNSRASLPAEPDTILDEEELQQVAHLREGLNNSFSRDREARIERDSRANS
jgi:hypothetical protein